MGDKTMRGRLKRRAILGRQYAVMQGTWQMGAVLGLPNGQWAAFVDDLGRRARLPGEFETKEAARDAVVDAHEPEPADGA